MEVLSYVCEVVAGYTFYNNSKWKLQVHSNYLAGIPYHMLEELLQP